MARIHVCCCHGMEVGVREAMILLLSKGNDLYPALGLTRATERLAMLKTTKKYIAEAYGTTDTTKDRIMGATWKAALEKASRTEASLRKIRLPIPPFRDSEKEDDEDENSFGGE